MCWWSRGGGCHGLVVPRRRVSCVGGPEEGVSCVGVPEEGVSCVGGPE